MKSLFYILCFSGTLLLSGCNSGSDSEVTYTKGFLPNPNGFSFANDGKFDVADFSDSVLASWYGVENICYNNQVDNCAITAYGNYQRSAAMISQQGGQCYGFSVAAAMLYDGTIQFEGKSIPAEYNPAAVNAYDLTRADAGRLIAAKASNQSTQAVRDHLEKCSEGDMLTQYNTIKDSLSQPSKDPIALIAFYAIDGGGGHAVTPYKIEETSKGAKIYVYDNNFPYSDLPNSDLPNSDELTFNIDFEKNTWEYGHGKTNTYDDYFRSYRGEGKTNPFCSIPLSLTVESKVIATLPDNSVKISLGAKHLNIGIENSDGQIQGYDFKTKEHLDQIPGSLVYKVFEDGVPPFYYIPIDPNLTDLAEIDTAEKLDKYFAETLMSTFGATDKKTKQEPASLSVEALSERYKSSMVIENLSIGPKDLMKVAFHPSGRFLGFQKETLSNDLPLIKLYFDDLNRKEGARHEVELLSELPVGVSVSAFIDNYKTISIFITDARDDTTVPLSPIKYKVESEFFSIDGNKKMPSVEKTQDVDSAHRFNLEDDTSEIIF